MKTCSNTKAIKDIYENIFYNLTTKEFMKYWDLEKFLKEPMKILLTR